MIYVPLFPAQSAFVARELDASDADGSGRGADKLYHQALSYRGQARTCFGPQAASFGGL